jgi:hypothetical protein
MSIPATKFFMGTNVPDDTTHILTWSRHQAAWILLAPPNASTVIGGEIDADAGELANLAGDALGYAVTLVLQDPPGLSPAYFVAPQ